MPKDRKSTRLNSSHVRISYAVFCLKKKNKVESMDSDYEKIKNQIEIAANEEIPVTEALSSYFISRLYHLRSSIVGLVVLMPSGDREANASGLSLLQQQLY